MALQSQSLFTYGLKITEQNRSIDFRSVSLGPVLQATLAIGYYSVTTLAQEIERAMNVADVNNNYTLDIDRTVNGGLENRITIESYGAYLSLLFGSGPRAASSVASLIGFAQTDYTGDIEYTSSTSTGTVLVTTYAGHNFIPQEFNRQVFGKVNVATSGLKEAVVFNIQAFIEIEFRHEAKAKVMTEWVPFLNWAIRQRPFEFTPEYTDPTTIYDVTLEKTAADGQGLAFKFKEMLPRKPNLYQTGTMTMRLNASTYLFT